VYSIGDCPACPDFGQVVVLTSKADGNLVYYCPACGTAWLTPPAPDRIDQVNSLEEVAPCGVKIATRLDIERFCLSEVAKETESYHDLDEIV
jgi:hypothetical protein